MTGVLGCGARVRGQRGVNDLRPGSIDAHRNFFQIGQSLAYPRPPLGRHEEEQESAAPRAEQLAAEAQDAGRVPCAECGRKLKPEGLIEFGGVRICKPCHEHHREVARTKRAPIHSTHHDEHEKQRVKWLAGLLGVLFLIALLRWLFG